MQVDQTGALVQVGYMGDLLLLQAQNGHLGIVYLLAGLGLVRDTLEQGCL